MYIQQRKQAKIEYFINIKYTYILYIYTATNFPNWKTKMIRHQIAISITGQFCPPSRTLSSRVFPIIVG